MPNTARIFCRLQEFGSPAGTPADGVAKVRVEWSQLHGARVNGKLDYTSGPIVSRDRLARDIVDALVVYLNAKFPTANYTDRDVEFWGS